MPTNQPQSHRPVPEKILDEAAAWLARRDRGLTPAEQDDYMAWLQADPRHTEAVMQHAAALERMMQLYEWQPAHDSEPNPDLFAPPRRRTWWLGSAALAAAAALAFAYAALWRNPTAPVPAAAPKSHLKVNERLALPDGSRVELKDGSQVVVQYSDRERRVKLIGGEASFAVWKDAARPFIVDVSGVEVRAVGTAFNVRLDPQSVEVLVTEGSVKVGSPSAGGGPGLVTSVSKGERAVVRLMRLRPATAAKRPEASHEALPVVTAVSAAEISRELDWQAPRLQFNETPLAEAVAEFNRLNREQLILGEPGLAERRIGGTFRPDTVEGFVRLLDTTLEVSAEKDGENRTVLRRRR